MADISRLPPQLAAYWLAGKGAALIRWGEPGDFMRCVEEVQKAVVKGGNAPLSDRAVKGLCSNLHVEATHARPGHAATEQIGKG